MVVKSEIMDSISVTRAVSRISHEIIEHNHGVDNVVLIGIVTRGVPLSDMIWDNISRLEGVEIPKGKLDITLYRDDLSQIDIEPRVNGTDVPFDITDKDVVLVDDVLYTGRTVRAAVDALMSIGRPRTVQLAVLVDRGHRELPIRADYVGKNVPTSRSEVIGVKLIPTDGVQSVLLYDNK